VKQANHGNTARFHIHTVKCLLVHPVTSKLAIKPVCSNR